MQVGDGQWDHLPKSNQTMSYEPFESEISPLRGAADELPVRLEIRLDDLVGNPTPRRHQSAVLLRPLANDRGTGEIGLEEIYRQAPSRGDLETLSTCPRAHSRWLREEERKYVLGNSTAARNFDSSLTRPRSDLGGIWARTVH